MRYPGVPGWYIGQRFSDPPENWWIIAIVGGDQPWDFNGPFTTIGSWPWHFEENYEPWP